MLAMSGLLWLAVSLTPSQMSGLEASGEDGYHSTVIRKGDG